MKEDRPAARRVLPILVLALATCAVLYAQTTALQEDVRQRRARFMEQLSPDTMAVLFSAPTRTYSREIEYPYRQDSNLYYLTGLEQDETTLALLPGKHGRLGFCRGRDTPS